MPVRPLVAKMIRRKMLKAAKAHGLGRHSRADIERLAACDLAAVSAIVGSGPI